MDEKDKAQEGLKRVIAEVPLGIYRHCKGGIYTVYSHTIDERSMEPRIHYYSHEKKTRWTRSWENFTSAWDGSVVQSWDQSRLLRFTFERPASLHELLEAAGLVSSTTSLSLHST
jgi:hypothetical protein